MPEGMHPGSRSGYYLLPELARVELMADGNRQPLVRDRLANQQDQVLTTASPGHL